MVFVLFFIGLTATVLGAIPPGASNLAVIKTTLQEDICESLKISYGAGIGEVILALIAFSFGSMVHDFYTMNLWIQVIFIGIFVVAGAYFLKKQPTNKRQKAKRHTSKYATGFALSVINPPVLIFWVLVFSFLKGNYTLQDNLTGVILLFSGIFIGKVATLYAYGKLGTRMQQKRSQNPVSLNKIIGVVLISLSIIQTSKLLFL